ncbi:hypothetical protein B0E45_10905 [Sinorhizobium sp. A49]|nr:hypothetical protein B0E45_10905 [Sinorhizobium sp. A49]
MFTSLDRLCRVVVRADFADGEYRLVEARGVSVENTRRAVLKVTILGEEDQIPSRPVVMA